MSTAKGTTDPLLIAADAAVAAFDHLSSAIVDTGRLLKEKWAGKVVVALQAGPHADPTENVRENLENEPVRRLLLDSWRRMMEAADPQVEDLICLLTADYVRDKKPIDAFFRGATRMFANLDSVELRSLSALVGAVVELARPEGFVHLDASRAPDAEKGNSIAVLDSIGAPIAVLHGIFSEVEIFHNLKQNGLGRDLPGGVLDITSGPHAILIHTITLRRLKGLFDQLPKPPATGG